MQTRRSVARGLALVALSLLVVTSCKDTTINQHAGGDAHACAQESTCSGDGALDESGVPPVGEPSPVEPETPSADMDRSGGDAGSEDSVGVGDGDSNVDLGQESGTGSVAGEVAPVRVELSGGNLPDGLRDSVDGCWMGVCTDWSVDDVVVGAQSFGTGFVIECTIACGKNESGYFQMKPAGKYSRLDATFGIAADSPGDDKTETLKVDVINQGAGKILYSETLEYGRSYTLAGFDISNVGVLRISFEGALGMAHGAVGAPVVRN